MEMLVEEVIGNYSILFPGKNDKIPMITRNAAWTCIMQKVNSLGVAMRTIPELKKKWSDLKKKVIAKMANIARYARQTGGGPSCQEELTEMEEKVGATCSKEQIEGFGTVDVCFSAINPCQRENTEEDNLCPDSNEDNEPENLDHPDYDVSELVQVNRNESLTDTVPSRELTLPSDLGLTVAQTNFLTEYTKEHIKFMAQVDQRLLGLENAMLRQGEKFIEGSNTVSKGLSKISTLLEKIIETQSVNLTNNTQTTPQIPPNITEYMETVPTESSSSTTTTPLRGSIGTISPTHLGASFPSSPSYDDEDIQISHSPLDLTVTKMDHNPQTLVDPQIRVETTDQPQSAAQFLMSCKQELALPTKCSTTSTPCANVKKSNKKGGDILFSKNKTLSKK
ncbi:uncharacterized protein LOC130293667 [Hyla sarda]|uniref:uncharacterized protein LOC130293667 n=1 Tax=Hyla sarda TaxID=327740 RepID=UPI0024C3A616|nr:uncharacterized protein LOC130293667 [Hyla sarda]